MIDNEFWGKISNKWITENDGIDIPDDTEDITKKIQSLKNDFLIVGDNDGDMDALLEEFGFDFDDD